MEIDTALDRVFPAPHRVDKSNEVVVQFVHQEAPMAWEWLRLLGPLISLEKLVPQGRSHIRHLQFVLRRHWNQDLDARKTPVRVTAEVLVDLMWWIDPNNLLAGTSQSSGLRIVDSRGDLLTHKHIRAEGGLVGSSVFSTRC